MEGFTPEWARHAVWYQILPERFANGQPSNDPTPASLDGSLHAGALPEGWRIHPWTSDWYALQPWEAAAGKPLVANLNDRRYGGDLAGILQRLPYLQDLGVNAIYLNPVFDAPSHHKYDASTLHHVDVHLGPDPDGDRALMAREVGDDPSTWVWTAADRQLLELIDAVHARGMRIILDGVFNDVKDLDAFRVECVQGFEMGFDGKTLIHPGQVDICNEVWAPSDADIEHARGLIAAFDEAIAEGKGVVTYNGRMIENLHVANAQRVLAVADAIPGISGISGPPRAD